MMLRSLLVLALCGCSFGLGPPPRPTLSDCSYTVPKLDLAVAIMSLTVSTVLLVSAATCDESAGESADLGPCFGDELAGAYVGVPAAVLALLYGGGSTYGFVVERECFRRAAAPAATPAAP